MVIPLNNFTADKAEEGTDIQGRLEEKSKRLWRTETGIQIAERSGQQTGAEKSTH